MSYKNAIIKYYNAFQERVTGAVANINTDHKYIHEGIAFKAHLEVGDLAAEATESYSLKTPPEKYLHFKNFKLTSVGASVKVEIFRGTTANPLTIDSAGGVASELVGANNVNDASSLATGTEIKKTPTYVGAESGEVWDYIIAPGSSTNQFQSVSETSVSDNFEYVMKPDIFYVIKFTNLSGGGGDAASDVGLDMFWYEEDSA